MRVITGTVILLPSISYAWMGAPIRRLGLQTNPSLFSYLERRQSTTCLYVSNSTADGITGRVLEGGKVIDFGAVKASEKAETALQHAKHLFMTEHLPHHQEHHDPHHEGIILGINDDVINEVGHDLGKFADSETVQKCAAYLRSKAPAGMFEESPPTMNDRPPSVVSASAAQKVLSKAYTESGEVTGAFAKTFYMGTMLLGEEARKSIWAIYVWCRRTDEIVDAPRENDADMLKDLSEWEVRLENLWKYGTVVDVYDLCLLDVRIKYPTLDIQPFMDMIRGMLMDVPDLGQERYETFDELHLYCYRVAGTVGVMSLPIFGCAEGYDDEIARYVLGFACTSDLTDALSTENQHFRWALLFN